jgi:hypothetical protein
MQILVQNGFRFRVCMERDCKWRSHLTQALPMELLAATNLVKDSNGNFYNNIVEVGPLLRVAPLRHMPSLTMEAQYLRGFYFTHDATNPYGPRYGDVRIFLIWSKTF